MKKKGLQGTSKLSGLFCPTLSDADKKVFIMLTPDVADEGGGVDDRGCPFPECVVPVRVGHFLLLKPVPLVQQVVCAVLTHLQRTQEQIQV
jgi:hypothetical protein